MDMQSLVNFKQSLHPQPHPGANGGMSAASTVPAAASTSATASSSSGDSATITANDFLQLLVAEMKNQDPTSDQDPNEYINQLVQVNSLQQLISINQELSGVGTGSGSGSSGAVHAGPADAEASPSGSGMVASQAQRPKQPLGTAEGTPAAALSTALAPRPGQPPAPPDPPALTGGRPPSPPGPASGHRTPGPHSAFGLRR